MDVFTLLRKTYAFIVIRFLVICGTLIPIYHVVHYYIDFFFRMFGLGHTVGIIRAVFSLSFGYIGFMVGWFIFGFMRKTILFYVKTAHVIAITKLCIEDDSDSLVIESFLVVMNHFLSTNIFYVFGGVLTKSIDEVCQFILKQDVLPILKSNNVITKLLGKVIKTTLSYSNEIILSYVFIRCRIREIHQIELDKQTTPRPGRKKLDSTKEAETVKDSLGYVVDGICLYVKSCLHLMKSAFITVLAVQIFGYILVGILAVILFTLLDIGLSNILVILIISIIAYQIIIYTFIEPYETIALISNFYIVVERDIDVETDSVKDKLLAVSSSFKKLVSKALGRAEAKVPEESGMEIENVPNKSILEENLLELAQSSLFDLISEKDSGNGETISKNSSFPGVTELEDVDIGM